jgi:hypothetical protein
MIRHNRLDSHTSLSATRRQSPRQLMPRTGSADASRIKPEAPRATRLTFIQDFTGEHSTPGLRNTAIGIPGTF